MDPDDAQPQASPDAEPDAEPRSYLRRALLVALATRLALCVVATAATYSFGVQPVSWAQKLPRLAEPFRGAAGHILNPWAVWDGVWYIKIASNGYAPEDSSVAFFPLYPLAVRWTSMLTAGNYVVAGIVLSWVCYFVAVWLLYRLVARELGHRAAYRTIWFLSIFPTAFYWQAVYSESLFLMLSVACIMWSREGRWKLAGLAGLLAALTRSTGFMLLVPMAVCYFEQRGWRLRRVDAQAASLLMVVEGLMVWMAYLSLGFGKPLLFAQSQERWRRSLAAPTVGLWQGILSAIQGVRQYLSGQTRHLYWPALSRGQVNPQILANVINLSAVAIALLAVWYGLRRLPAAYSAYALATIIYPLCFPARYVPLTSMPRFVLVAFPIFMSMALFTDRRPRTHVAVSVLFCLVLAALTAKFAVFSWVA